jgi:hypothetical protein
VGLAFDPDNGRLLAVNDAQLHLYAIDPVTAKASTLGGAIGFLRASGVAYAPGSDTIFGSVRGDPGLLITYDRSTGSGRIVGPLGFEFVESLTYDPNADVLYGYDANADRLLVIDTGTGAATPVADTPLFDNPASIPWGIAYNPNDDVLYGVTTFGVYDIDPATAARTKLATPSNALFGAVYDAATDTLYALTPDSANGTRNLVSIDRATGDLTKAADNTISYGDFAFLP